MALRTLMLKKNLDNKRKAYTELEKRDSEFESRRAELEAAIDEVETDEQRDAVEEEIEKFDIVGSNMTLGNRLEVNFLITKKDLTTTGNVAVITHTRADGTETVIEMPMDQWSVMGSYHKISVGIAAKEMTEELNFKLLDAEGYVISDLTDSRATTSARDYAFRALPSSAVDALSKIMIVDMMNYGTAAQTHFGYNTENLADALLTEDQKALATGDVECVNYQEKSSTLYGSNLTLEDSMLMSMFFKGLKNKDISSMYAIVSFTGYDGVEHNRRVEGADFTKYTSDIYRIFINDIVVADARQLVTVTVYNADGSVYGACTDSVESITARSA